MPWTPALEPALGEPIVDNLRAHLLANQADALLWANGGPGLAPFTDVWLSTASRPTLNPPLLAFDRHAVGSATDEDNQAVGIVHELSLQVFDTAGDPDALSRQIFRRVRAVDSMLRHIPPAALLSGVTTTGYARVDVNSIDYGFDGRLKDTTQYGRVATIDFTVTLTEVG
jgi:hypothetical protein